MAFTTEVLPAKGVLLFPVHRGENVLYWLYEERKSSPSGMKNFYRSLKDLYTKFQTERYNYTETSRTNVVLNKVNILQQQSQIQIKPIMIQLTETIIGHYKNSRPFHPLALLTTKDKKKKNPRNNVDANPFNPNPLQQIEI